MSWFDRTPCTEVMSLMRVTASSPEISTSSAPKPLAIFNLLPLPPLDGARVVPLLLPRKSAERYEEIIDKVGFWPLIVLFLLELPPQFKGPLHLWFELWSPLFKPTLNYLGIPAFW